MQGGWEIEPTVITTKKVFKYEFDSLDLEDIFDGKTLIGAISALTERYEFLLANHTLGVNVYDIEFHTDYDYDGEGLIVQLIGKYAETDEQLTQRHRNLIEQQRDKSARELLEYQRLHAKFGDTHGK